MSNLNIMRIFNINSYNDNKLGTSSWVFIHVYSKTLINKGDWTVINFSHMKGKSRKIKSYKEPWQKIQGFLVIIAREKWQDNKKEVIW